MTRVMKHNPAFLDDDELVAGFRVRQTDLDLLVETLHENIDARSNQHVLVIGPRGMGKTTLVRRVAIEARRDETLRAAWFPIVFGEESYAISDAGEFWLEAILHLADALGDPEWHALYETLLAEMDSETLRVRALARLTEFADARGVRLLLIVENLQMVLGEQLDDDEASSLRHTLQTEPRVMLLGTAANRFDAIERPEQPMFELFRVQSLEPLSEDEARTLWDAVAERPLKGRRIRPVHILTGGNPRLLSIVAAFSQKRSFAELMTDLVHLVDEHTTYFKANVEALPPGERKVLVALADLWARATSRQVAERARLEPKKTAAYLKRLSDRGVVQEVDRIGRVRLYELTERLYNIYHLMRRRGGEQAQVKALVEFMTAFYDTDELGAVVSSIAAEACGLEATDRRFHLWALAELMNRSMDAKERKAWLAALPPALFEFSDLPPTLTSPDATPVAYSLPDVATARATLEAAPEDFSAHVQLLAVLMHGGMAVDEGLLETISDWPLPTTGADRALVLMGRMGAHVAGRHFELARANINVLATEYPEEVMPHFAIGFLCASTSELRSEAEDAFQTALTLDPSRADAWVAWASLTDDASIARKALRQAIDLAPRNADAWLQLALVHVDQGDLNAAIEAHEYAIELQPGHGMSRLLLCGPLVGIGRWQEALAHFTHVLSHGKSLSDLFRPISVTVALLALTGNVDDVRTALIDTPHADLLAPIRVALDLLLERPTQPPRELEEVARDVLADMQAVAQHFKRSAPTPST